MDDTPKFRPTHAPDGWQQRAEEGQSVSFETAEQAAEREAAWREFAQPGARIPLLWEDGVTTLEIASVGEDGTIEVRPID